MVITRQPVSLLFPATGERRINREDKRQLSLERNKWEELKQTWESERTKKKLHYEEALSMSDDEGQSLLDPTFESTLPSTSTYIVEHLSVSTRSTTPLPNPETKSYSPYESKSDLPKVKVRTSRQKINEQIIRCTVQCLANYKVSHRDLSGIIVHTANIIFVQHWELPSRRTDWWRRVRKWRWGYFGLWRGIKPRYVYASRMYQGPDICVSQS